MFAWDLDLHARQFGRHQSLRRSLATDSFPDIPLGLALDPDLELNTNPVGDAGGHDGSEGESDGSSAD